MKNRTAWLLLILVSASAVQNGHAQESAVLAPVVTQRVVPMEIKIVFIGFDSSTLDTGYLLWKENVPHQRVNAVLTTDNATGVVYNFSYSFMFTNESFRTEAKDYLDGIAKYRTEYNPWFERELSNTIYDAQSAERWFIAQSETYGGLPRNGYTFLFANLTTLPSITWDQLNRPQSYPPTPHYYSNDYVDTDRQYRIGFRDFAVGWGGKSRLWFLDFSAGPEYWTWNNDALPHLPLQIAMSRYEIDIHKEDGKRWLTQLIADYITEVVWTFAAPQFVYYPEYSDHYRIVVNVFDNRTEADREKADISSTIQEQTILDAFKLVVPYSKLDVEVRIHVLDEEKDSPIRMLIINSTFTPPSNLRFAPYVDVRPVYRYLEENIAQYVKTGSGAARVLPVFAFAFPSGFALGYTYRWLVSRNVDTVTNFYGLSLGDASFVGLSQDEFLRGNFANPQQRGKGIGFTQFIIHELGHSLGLMHPNTYTYLGDFVSSAMSYYSWEYGFSQFDKDALNRAHADQLMTRGASYLAQARALAATKLAWLDTSRNMELAERLLNTAVASYYQMNYTEAVKLALQASADAKAALNTLRESPATIAVVFLASTIVAFIAGTLMMFAVLRRYIQNARMISAHRASK